MIDIDVGQRSSPGRLSNITSTKEEKSMKSFMSWKNTNQYSNELLEVGELAHDATGIPTDDEYC